MELRPSDIRFSQDSINNLFDKRSRHPYKTIGQTLDDLCENRCSVHDIPRITVVKEEGKWITADNRRLWVFREMERLGKCETIPVSIGYHIPVQKRTSYNGGTSVSVRRNPGGFWHSKSTVAKQQPSGFSPPQDRSTRATVLGNDIGPIQLARSQLNPLIYPRPSNIQVRSHPVRYENRGLQRSSIYSNCQDTPCHLQNQGINTGKQSTNTQLRDRSGLQDQGLCTLF